LRIARGRRGMTLVVERTDGARLGEFVVAARRNGFLEGKVAYCSAIGVFGGLSGRAAACSGARGKGIVHVFIGEGPRAVLLLLLS